MAITVPIDMPPEGRCLRTLRMKRGYASSLQSRDYLFFRLSTYKHNLTIRVNILGGLLMQTSDRCSSLNANGITDTVAPLVTITRRIDVCGI
jgi:hypothetical protein